MELATYLKTHFRADFSDTDQLPIILSNQVFKKDAIITDYGQKERRIYFINSGIVQLTMLHDGEEKIIDFFFENNFVCAYTSFLKQEPSDVRVTALLECQTEVILYSDLQKAYDTSLIANKIGRMMTEQIYIVKTRREKDFLTKSAQERYADLIASRPDILKLIPVHKIQIPWPASREPQPHPQIFYFLK
jgi:CRP-like cAMP-binding protein